MNNSQSVPHIVIDEISLEGLDGITVESMQAVQSAFR